MQAFAGPRKERFATCEYSALRVSAHRLTRALILLLVPLSGCATYHFGTQSLYRTDIYTVHVPVFESESFRVFLGERLTEAVVKEIELKTPYKVSQAGVSDSVLYGRLLEEDKYTLTENINDEPRDIEVGLQLEVSWRGRGGELLAGPETFRVPNSLTRVAQAVHFVPEGGQSMGTAQQEAIQKLAEQIVSRMELPW